MSKIQPMKLTLLPSPAEDTVGYAMYFVPAGGDLTATDPATGKYTASRVQLDAGLTYDVAQFVELADVDGIFDVGFTAIDDRGNEGDMGAFNYGVPFDFLAPPPPAGATFSNE